MNTRVVVNNKPYDVSTIKTGGEENNPVVWDTAVYPATELGNYGDCPNCRRKYHSEAQADRGHTEMVADIRAGRIVPKFILADEWKKRLQKRRK